MTDEDIQKGIEELAAETGKNVAKVRAEYDDPQRRQILIGMILEDKVLDVIEGKANIRVAEPHAEAAAADGHGERAIRRCSKAKRHRNV